jgi:hypothetical protein
VNPVKLAVEAVTIGCCGDLDDFSDDVLVAGEFAKPPMPPVHSKDQKQNLVAAANKVGIPEAANRL